MIQCYTLRDVLGKTYYTFLLGAPINVKQKWSKNGSKEDREKVMEIGGQDVKRKTNGSPTEKFLK